MESTIKFQLLLFIMSTTYGASVLDSKAPAAEVFENKWLTLDGKPTLLIGHRGEKVFMPEHTLASYELASAEGADYVEPDLTLTKDGELVCYHDLILKSGTDVEEHLEYADRMRNFTGWLDNDYVEYTNEWFIQNFTVAELRGLHVRQKETGIRMQYFNKLFHVPTFQEYLTVVHKMAHKLNKQIGIIPELKHPKFNNMAFPNTDRYMENKLLNTLKEFGYALKAGDKPACKFEDENIPCGDVVIQSFDQYSLKYLQNQTNRDLMMLVDDDAALLTYEGLRNISTFAAYLGVWKEHMYVGPEAVLIANGREIDKAQVAAWGGFVPAHRFVPDAHELGLKMSLYTIYDSREKSHRGCAKACNPENKTEELLYYFMMGVDGMFVENVMEARELRLEFENQLAGNSAEGVGAGSRSRCSVLVAALAALFILFRM